MVCKKVLQKLGTLAMAAVAVAAPVLAVKYAGAETLLVRASGGPTNYVTAVDNSAVTTASGQTLHSTLNGTFTVTAVDGLAITTPAAVCAEAFGIDAKSVNMLATNSGHGPKAETSLNDGLAQLANDNVEATKCAVVDLLAFVGDTQIIDISKPITVSMGIPADAMTEGCDYAVVRVQEGGRVSILPDLDSDASTMTFATDGFGVFALVKAPAGSFDKYR